MALDERARNQMYDRFREVMGDDVADTVMESLSPTGWRDLATKDDLLATKDDLKVSLELLEHKLTAGFEKALRGQTKTYIAWTSGLTAILVAVFGWITTIATR